MGKKKFLLILGTFGLFLGVFVFLFYGAKVQIESKLEKQKYKQENLKHLIQEEEKFEITLKELNTSDSIVFGEENLIDIEKKKLELEKNDVLGMVEEQTMESKQEGEWVMIKGKTSGNLLGVEDKKLGIQKIKFVEEDTEQNTGDAMLIIANDSSDFQNQLETIKEIQNTDDVFFIEPNYTYEMFEMTDPLYEKQWGLYNEQNSSIDIEKAWTFNQGENVVVSIIDSGIDNTHEDLKANLWRTDTCVDWENNTIDGGCNLGGYDIVNNDNDPYSDDGSSHGTHVAGIIFAVANNELGIIGVAPNVEIMALRACDGNQSVSGNCTFTVETISKAIYFAVNNGADIINMSLGGSSYSYTIEEAITYANNQGVLVVAAAGNSGKNNDTTSMYPANLDLPNIISVAAIDKYNHLASFSNYGKTAVDIAAPGVEILSTVPMDQGKYDYKNGTSMATPYVSGVAALVSAQNTDYKYPNIKNNILEGAINMESLETKIEEGRRLTAYKALAINSTPYIESIVLKDKDGNPIVDSLESGVVNIDIKISGGNELVNNSSKYTLLVKDEEGNILDTVSKIGYKEGFKYNFTYTGQYILEVYSENEFSTVGNKITFLFEIELEENQTEIFDETDDKTFVFPQIEEDVDNQIDLVSKEIDVALDIDLLATNSSNSIKNLANDLDNDPVKIYEYVLENIEYVPYVGLRQSSEQCLESKKCNDIEIASLLVDLYRNSGIPSVYANGYLEFDIEFLQKVFSVDKKRDVYRILLSMGHKVKALDNNGNQVALGFNDFENMTETIAMEMFWVRVYLEGNLKPANPFVGLDNDKIVEKYKTLDDENMQIYAWRDILPIGKYQKTQTNMQQFDLSALYSSVLSCEDVLQDINGVNEFEILFDATDKLGILPLEPRVRNIFIENVYSKLPDNANLKVKFTLEDEITTMEESKVFDISVPLEILLASSGSVYFLDGIDKFSNMSGDVYLNIDISYKDKIIFSKEKQIVSNNSYDIYFISSSDTQGLGNQKSLVDYVLYQLGYRVYNDIGIKIGDDIDWKLVPYSLSEDIFYDSKMLERVVNLIGR